MPISSYVIRCAAEDQPAVRDQLGRIPGIQMGEAAAMGIAVVTETETSEAAEALGEKLQALEGVKSAVLVYHNFEDVADTTT